MHGLSPSEGEGTANSIVPSLVLFFLPFFFMMLFSIPIVLLPIMLCAIIHFAIILFIITLLPIILVILLPIILAYRFASMDLRYDLIPPSMLSMETLLYADVHSPCLEGFRQ